MKLVIFDMDGTLLDTISYTIDVLNASLQNLGYAPQPQDSYDSLLGKSVNGMSKALLETVNPEYRDGDVFTMEKQIRRNALRFDDFHPIRPYPGIVEMLKELRSQNYSLYVLSNTPHPLVQSLCRMYLPPLFSGIYGEGKVPRKPSAEGVRQILWETGAHRTEALLAGDTMVDIETACNADIDAVGVTWGCTQKEDFTKKGITALAECTEELLECISRKF